MHTESLQVMSKVEKKHWWFRVRVKLLILLLKKYVATDKPLNILDIGCGTGLISQALQSYGQVYSFDQSATALEFCRQRGIKNLYQGTGDELPFTDNKFDLIIALDVLEHVKNDQGVVNEIKRVLKDNGIFICFVPAFKSLWSKHDKVSMHFRRYTTHSLLQLFSLNNWDVLKTSYFNFFLFIPILLMRKIMGLFKTPDKEELEKMGLFNSIFYLIFKFELIFLPYLNFPFGVSLLGIFKKK